MQHANYIIACAPPALRQLTAPVYADVAHVSGAGGEREGVEVGLEGLEKSGGGQGEGQDSPHSAWPRLGMSTRSGGLRGYMGACMLLFGILGICLIVFMVLNIRHVLWEQIKYS